MDATMSFQSLKTVDTMGTGKTDSSVIRVAAKQRYRGQLFWKGKLGIFTMHAMYLPWKLWWQTLLLLVITTKYVIHFLLCYNVVSFNEVSRAFVDLTLAILEMFYIFDLIINMLHIYWPVVRLYMRVYRRNRVAVAYDAISCIPLTWIMQWIGEKNEFLDTVARWLGILRIYRLISYFREIGGKMQTNRKVIFVLEHLMMSSLVLHAASCLWYHTHKWRRQERPWYNLAFPPHVDASRLMFDKYSECWYYCCCRYFNVIFSDAFPITATEKWLTTTLMILGFVLARYQFIGYLSWEIVIENRRWSNFVEMYHHMINYLEFCEAPVWLVEQAKNYKRQLWEMKDGVLTSDHFKQLPHPLQMQLIFDINVGHFHNTLLFRDTGEAFMRQVSLIMRHEIFLAGQQIWSQGVVKHGMICVKRGVLEMLSDEDDESPMIAFKEETVLGELSLFYSLPAKVTVTAATYVELQVLRRTDFMRAMVENPHMLKQIRNNIEKRLCTTKERQTQIVDYDKGDSRLIRTRYRPMKVLKDNLAGVEEEDATFVDDSHLYYRDLMNERQPKFTPEYLELYRLSSNVTTVEPPKICLKANFPWILEPNTNFTNLFDIIHFLMVLYVCMMTPYFVIESRTSDIQRVMDSIVLAGLVLNMYIQLTTAIVGKTVRKETVKEIAEVKMSTFGFYLDIISVFPIHIFSETLDPHGTSIWGQVIRLCPILQVWHIWDYMVKWETSFNAHFRFMTLSKFCMLILIFCYWSGCFLYMYACPKRLCLENSWMAKLIFWETKVFVINNSKHERPMLSSLAFGTGVFTASGIAQISPGNGDLLVVCLIFVMGSFMCCFYTAKMCSLFLLSTQRKSKFKESMRELFYFLTFNRVSSKIKARVGKFFCVQWYYNNAVSTQEMFKDISSNIQQEVLSIETVKTLKYCPLFQDCSRDFLQTVASNTSTIVLPDNEIVQHAGDIGRDMYILQMGHCNVLNYQGKIVRSIGPGSHFGVIEMLFGLPKVHTVLTTTNCQLRYVEYSALVQCWSSFPDISHLINETIRSPELMELAAKYEEAKLLTGKIGTKTNRIAQEIKESFVVLNSLEQRRQFNRAFEKLGIMRFVKYIFLPGCITPHGIFLKFWCALRLILAVYYIIVVPYNIATKQSMFQADYPWTDVLLYLDILVMSYVSYYDERSILVTHPLLIVTRYLKNAFLWDILTVFPFDRLLRIVNENSNLDLCRVNRLLLVTRITGAFTYWEGDIMKLNQAVVLLKFLPLALAFVNFMTAFIFMNACTPFMTEGYSYIRANCSRTTIVNEDSYEIMDALTRYTYTLFWVFEVFAGCSCTPTLVGGKMDVWLVMIMQICGYLYFAFMYGYVTSTRSAAAHALLEHTENTKDLENFLYQENVDPVLTVKTMKYFEYVWKRTNGSNPQQICRCLNSALMEDTLVFMYEHALREVPLFGNVERSFIRVITQHLTEMYFLKGETVVQCRDLQSYIYIIYRGKVDVMSSYNEMLTCMGPGGMFGNFTGQPYSSSDVSIFASRSLDLLVIPSQTFFNLIRYYPKIREPLKKAFEMSKDYILPITMNMMDDSSSESEENVDSQDSSNDSRSSSRFEGRGHSKSQVSMRSSHSNVSMAKSASLSVSTFQSYKHASNLLRPGTWLFQCYGYMTSFVVTSNYVILLYEITTLNDCYILFWIQAFFDIFFYLKIYIDMHQGYINKRGEMETHAVRCRQRYFRHKTWVISDFAVNFPIEVFFFCFKQPLGVIHYLRVHKLLRIKYLVEFYKKTSAELTNNLTTLQWVTTLMVVILVVHSFTCVWLLVLVFFSPHSVIRTLKLHLIDEYGETPQNKWDFTTSLYVVVAEMTTTGGDEFIIEAVLPMAILVTSSVCGKMMAAVVVATSMQVAYSTKYALNCYEQKTRELIDMLSNQGLSSYQLGKFWKYVQQLWTSERGRQLPVLLAQTPYVRRCDLMSAMFGHHLRNCYLFCDTEEPFLRQLTVVLDYTIFFPGNYVVVAGDSEAKMYFVSSGNVSVVSVRPDLTETTHELLGPGDVFGILQGLDRGIAHCFSYRAETKVSILTLSLDSWINILSCFPEAMRVICERADVLFAQI